MVVDLTEQEWQAVIQCMAYAPARESVPYMNKISNQVTPQIQQASVKKEPGNSREMPINIGEVGSVKQ